MNILAIVQSASLSLDLERPQTVFASTDRTWQEMADTVNTASRQILDDYDWQKLIKTAVLAGTGVATSFPLPDDYSRMVKDASLVGTFWRFYPAQQVQDFNQWLMLQNYPIAEWQQAWMVYGGNMNVMPALPLNEILSYGYISTNVVVGSDPTTFTADSDTYFLDDELLRLSIIWNWKESKGFDFSADLAKYQERMEKQRFRDVGSRQNIVTGGWRARAYGWPGGFV